MQTCHLKYKVAQSKGKYYTSKALKIKNKNTNKRTPDQTSSDPKINVQLKLFSHLPSQ